MIFDSRTDTVKLHHADKRFLAGARGVLRSLARIAADEDAVAILTRLPNLFDRYGIEGDEHLRREEKAETKSLLPPDDGRTPPY